MGRTAKIILWSVITAMVLALMLALFLAPGKIIGKVDLPVMTNYKYKNAEMYTAGNAEIATEGINRIDVDWVLGDVSMVLWDGKTVSVSEIGDFDGYCFKGILHLLFEFCFARTARLV